MKIAIVGTGYVGLVAGACLADAGREVTCVDLDASRIALLNRGGIPLYEPGLREVVERNRRDKRLSFTTSLGGAMSGTVAVLIAVGTPSAEGGEADLRDVFAAAEQIGRAMCGPTIIVNKSTVPVGTAEAVAERVRQVSFEPFDVVSNPEFLRQGSAIEDFTHPDRIIVGATSERSRAVMAELYAPFVGAGHPILFMDPRSAEMTKYAANSMLATRISFMNDIAALCERLGADIDSVREGISADHRIGFGFLSPGVGFGGSCLSKDVRALTAMAREVGLEFELCRAVERVNDRQKRALVGKATQHFGSLAGLQLAVWGLAFKPGTDDMREAPAITVITDLLNGGARVRAHDPVVAATARLLFAGRVQLADEPYAAAEGADGLLLMTEWREFRNPEFTRLRRIMRRPVLFDGRNLWDPMRVRSLGFTYYGVGRGLDRHETRRDWAEEDEDVAEQRAGGGAP